MLSLLVNLLFVALWCCLGFFAVRHLANRYFHEPRRADTAAFCVVLAFAIGALWPFSSRLGFSPATNTVVAAASNRANTAQLNPVARNVSAQCNSVTGLPLEAGFGSVDELETHSNKAMPDGSRLAFGVPYMLRGWAADVSHESPALAVCLVVDGRVTRGAKSLYGAARPDVAAVSHIPALLPTGFRITIVPRLLVRGRHELEVATLSQHGIFMIIAGRWHVTVR